MEPLRRRKEISGRNGVEHKVALYADNLLLFYQAQWFLSLLTHFGQFSGYKLNIRESELFPMNEAALKSEYSHVLFKVVAYWAVITGQLICVVWVLVPRS